MKRFVTAILCLAAGALLAGAEKSGSAFESVETKDLHNAHRVTDKLISGAAPETEQAFDDLRRLGVRTIISVDGAKPDVEAARRHGIRYVHLPITYSTVTDDQGKDIAKALLELPGPIYVHCHHGKHRSAAAVAVACVTNGWLEPRQAESVLQTFGTGKDYTGLWKAARAAWPVEAKELAARKVDYVAAAAIPELADHMVSIDEYMEHLKAIQKNGWKTPADHPDLDPAHEALQLQEHLRESARIDTAAARPADFRTQLDDAEASALALHETLAADVIASPAAEAAFARLAVSCTTCHAAYRN